jgi:hypothetical protein
MSGKGDRNRTADHERYAHNFDRIEWTAPKTTRTQGVESPQTHAKASKKKKNKKKGSEVG